MWKPWESSEDRRRCVAKNGVAKNGMDKIGAAQPRTAAGGRDGESMKRFGWTIRLRPEKREEYLRLHAAVWPEVEATISSCGIRNYTIFLRGDTLFGYYEYVGVDHDADIRRMGQDPATQRWWALTDPCQEPVDDEAPRAGWAELTEVWHRD